MNAIVRWLSAELARVRVAERHLVLRRLHGVLLTAVIAIAVILVLAAGIFVGYKLPYRTVPRPPIAPGQTIPKSSSPQCAGTDHVMGGCLPHKPVAHISLSADITATNQGPDLSNNDPVYSSSSWSAIAAHSAFAVYKVSQGTYYLDHTAAPMAALARPRGLVVGGYDFLDVCAASATTEAQVFYIHLVSDGLTGPNTLPPTGDAEYPLGSLSCNGRTWVATWVTTVAGLSHRQPMIYTGAWWWNPHIGSWWPAGSLAWVSGYTSSLSSVPRPAGQPHIDLWQLSDHGFNGATYADLSVWLDGASSFRSASLGGPSPGQVRGWIKIRGASLTAYYKHQPRCARPVLTTPACGQFAWRVDHFQKLIDTAHGYYPRCFGRHADLTAAECRIVRPAVAAFSNARRATGKALGRYGCESAQAPVNNRTCNTLRQRYGYFDRRAAHSVVASRLER